MILKGRGISKGKGQGEVVISEQSVSFLGGVNPADGVLTIGGRRSSISGKVFAFPRGRGSTVGSYTMLEMKRLGTLPSAIVNAIAEPIVTTGAVMTGVPLVDQIDISLLREEDHCVVDGDRGSVEIMGIDPVRVVTCLLTHRGKVLILKRSSQVGSFQGHWAGVSGFIEKGEGPMGCALKEIEEETGLTAAQLEMTAGPIMVRSERNIWMIHPFVFSVRSEELHIDWEHSEYRWVRPEEISGFETVPGMDRVLAALKLIKKE